MSFLSGRKRKKHWSYSRCCWNVPVPVEKTAVLQEQKKNSAAQKASSSESIKDATHHFVSHGVKVSCLCFFAMVSSSSQGFFQNCFILICIGNFEFNGPHGSVAAKIFGVGVPFILWKLRYFVNISYYEIPSELHCTLLSDLPHQFDENQIATPFFSFLLAAIPQYP